jgi:hypothetical protein
VLPDASLAFPRKRAGRTVSAGMFAIDALGAVIICDGMLMAPSTRTSVPFAGLSLVFPPSSDRSVTLGSSVMAIDEPGGAESLRVKTRCATTFPGAGAFDASGIRFVDSWNVSMSEMVFAVPGLNSCYGTRSEVIPDREKVNQNLRSKVESVRFRLFGSTPTLWRFRLWT